MMRRYELTRRKTKTMTMTKTNTVRGVVLVTCTQQLDKVTAEGDVSTVW